MAARNNSHTDVVKFLGVFASRVSLVAACQWDSAASVRRFVSCGDAGGSCPLHWCCEEPGESGAWLSLLAAKLGTAVDRVEVVKALLAAGADANTTNKERLTPVQLSVANKHEEVIKLFQDSEGLYFYEVVCLYKLFHLQFVSFDHLVVDGLPALKHACLNGRLKYIAPMVEHCLAEGRAATGSFAAVGSALVGRSDLVLACVAAWPECVHEVAEELTAGGMFARRGVLAGCAEGVRDTVQLAAAVSTALAPPRGLPSSRVANVHICGEPGAGKSMTLTALQATIDWSALFSSPSRVPLKDIPKVEGRTVGMESCTKKILIDSKEVIINFHDYGGQINFQVNHASHLDAPHSVYLVVVPLWSKLTEPERPYGIDEICRSYDYWLRFIYTVTAVRPLKCVTVVNFVRNAKPELLRQVLEFIDNIQKDFNRY